MENLFPKKWSKDTRGVWRLGVTCETCESLFVVTPEDISCVEQDIPRTRGLYSRPGDKFIYYDTCCPACGKQVSISGKPPQGLEDKEVPACTH